MDSIFVFWIIIALIVTAGFLLYPVTCRLGVVLDDWLALRRAERERNALSGRGDPRLEELTSRIAELEDEQRRLREHQDFVQSLLEEPRGLPGAE